FAFSFGRMLCADGFCGHMMRPFVLTVSRVDEVLSRLVIQPLERLKTGTVTPDKTAIFRSP
ncbi:MAG: hypothetical protein SOW68_09390, partial [Eubacteriales bacterium]|nr:hypothetical protein [Eubacteriales bacterium]